MGNDFQHEPIMLREIIVFLKIKKDGIYVDCTLGGAGHSFEICENLGQNGVLIGIDKDLDALHASKQRLAKFNFVKYVHDDFKNIDSIFLENEIDKIDGCLVDLGVSSYQLDTAERGFSFRFDAPLDMRMDKTQDLSAYDVVNHYSQEKLAKIIKEYGEENFANQIAKNIIKQRMIKPIETTFELVQIIEKSMPKKIVYSCGGASKKTFQAIRIEVNGELDKLENALKSIISHLKPNGIICVLSFHSLEDRIVKNVFKELAQSCVCPPKMPICVCGGNHAKVEIVTKHPIISSLEERKRNPRSTCAKLRVAKKL